MAWPPRSCTAPAQLRPRPLLSDWLPTPSSPSSSPPLRPMGTTTWSKNSPEGNERLCNHQLLPGGVDCSGGAQRREGAGGGGRRSKGVGEKTSERNRKPAGEAAAADPGLRSSLGVHGCDFAPASSPGARQGSADSQDAPAVPSAAALGAAVVLCRGGSLERAARRREEEGRLLWSMKQYV